MTTSKGPKQCPRCGQSYSEPPALSRTGLGRICSSCGTAEALEAWLRYLGSQVWAQVQPTLETIDKSMLADLSIVSKPGRPADDSKRARVAALVPVHDAYRAL